MLSYVIVGGQEMNVIWTFSLSGSEHIRLFELSPPFSPSPQVKK